MSPGHVGRPHRYVYIAICLLLLGSLGGCRTAEPPPADSALRQTEEPQSTQGEEQPAAESGQASSPTAQSTPLMKFEEANGLEIYQHYCMVCHGTSGEGDGFNAFNLDPKPRSLVDQRVRERLTDEELTRSITLGGAGRNQSSLMPGWGHTLNGRRVRYVIAYIRLLQRKAQSEEADSEDRVQASGAG